MAGQSSDQSRRVGDGRGRSAVKVVCVTVDCHDPRLVAEFWNAALQWSDVRVARDDSGATCRPEGDGCHLEFIRVPEAKVVKNRLHLGLHAGSLAELDAELTRLLDLGASIAWEEEFPPAVAASYRNVVLRDPEGNEFCLGGGSFSTG